MRFLQIYTSYFIILFYSFFPFSKSHFAKNILLFHCLQGVFIYHIKRIHIISLLNFYTTRLTIEIDALSTVL